MKKILFILFLALMVPINAMSANRYGCTGLTGGTAGTLDAIDITGASTPNVDNLADGDSAVVTTISGTTVLVYWYIFDADGTDAESSPTVIRPDDYATAGVWRLAVFNINAIPALTSLFVPKTDWDAQTVMIAVADDTPSALSVGEQTVLGRATGGDVSALSIDSDLSAVSANDDTVPSAKATKTALDAKESSTSNDIDPDRTNNDSDDDDKLDGDLVDPSANQTQEFTDSGDGNPKSDTVTFTADLMFGHKDLTCSDADTCIPTMSETGAVDGQVLILTNVSANNFVWSDQSGVQELPATCTLAQYEKIGLEYGVDRWEMLFCASNSLAVSQYATVEVDRIPITAFTDGATPPTAAAVVSSADGAFNCRAFSGTVDQDSFFTWKVPADIDATQGIKFSVSGVVGSATAPANTEVVAFSLAGVSIGNSDAAGSVGTAQTSSLTADATYAQYDSLDTAYSSAITVTNLAAGETVSFELIRLATTTDTYAQDFHPHTILIKYVRLHNATF